MHVPVRAARQPRLDARRFVRGIVVHHQMHLRPVRHGNVDLLEEVEEPGCPMPFVAFPDHCPRGDIERGKQRRRAVSNVCVGSAFGDTRRHRQHRLFAVQRLDLRFFIYTQHDSPVRRRHVKADDVLHLVDEQRIGREFERLAPMRLKAEGGPDAPDCRMRQARCCGHRSDRPMGGILRRAVQCAFDYRSNLIVRYGAWPTGPVFVGQTLDPLLHKPPAPFANSVLMHTEPRTSLLALKPFRAEQDHPAPVRERPRRLVSPNLCFEEGPFLLTQNDLVCQTPHHRIISRYTSS